MLNAEFYVAALEDAIAVYSVPSIPNADQGCLLTSEAFTQTLESYGIRISIDGANRALDNVFVGRFWRSLEHEGIYLYDHRAMGKVKARPERSFSFNNGERPYEALDYEIPDAIYLIKITKQRLETAA
jgi:putative transposase